MRSARIRGPWYVIGLRLRARSERNWSHRTSRRNGELAHSRLTLVW